MFKHTSKSKQWQIAGTEPGISADRISEIADGIGVLPATARLLASRGFDTPESARAFIGKDTGHLHDPFLLKDMDRAVERIRRALVNREKIVVYGDYDVDGVTSVTILYSYLRIHGADVSYYIPSRIGEGYGVNAEALKSFIADGITLMITVDTGITAIDELAEAKAAGLDTVVTDHHECRPELPDCAAVVNPRRPDCPYPFKELAGVGVAFKLICALEQNLRATSLYNAVKFAAGRCGELVAIGTIADVMPLVDENRIIVSYGLQLLEKSSNVGIRSLLRASGAAVENPDGSYEIKKRVTSSLVGFTLAPRINAAGRISNATLAVELFLTEYRDRADRIADELCEINRRRQTEENAIIEQAMNKISEQCSPDDYVIVLDDDHWHHGVIGIVCSRLTERYNLPSILVSFEGMTDGEPSGSDVGKGSGRSVKGLNLVEALAACQDTLVKYGGHELAAGLSIERDKLPGFRQEVNAYAAKVFAGHDPERTIGIDLKLDPSEISLKLTNELYLLEPYGVANAQPVFETDGFRIVEVTPLSGGRHTRLTVRSTRGINGQFTALCFGMKTDELGFEAGDTVDLAYNLDINEFHGRTSVQLLVKDIRPSAIGGGAADNPPAREDFARLWRCLKKNGSKVYSPDELSEASGFGEAVTGRMLEVFSELGLIALSREEGLITARVLPVGAKLSLDESPTYRDMLRGGGKSE